jgi:hypothetical protein
VKNQTRRSYLQEAGLDYATVYPDDLDITKVYPSGAYLVSAVFDGYRHARTYMGYTKKEAITNYLNTYNKKGR